MLQFIDQVLIAEKPEYVSAFEQIKKRHNKLVDDYDKLVVDHTKLIVDDNKLIVDYETKIRKFVATTLKIINYYFF